MSPSLGFGLPHTDENPYNANLGNCLGASFDLLVMPLLLLLSRSQLYIQCHWFVIMLIDYTDNPDENLEPGDVNMAKLRIMYKTRRLRRVGSDGAVVEVTELLVR